MKACHKCNKTHGRDVNMVCMKCYNLQAQEINRLREALQTIRDNHALPHTHRQGNTTRICEEALAESEGGDVLDKS